MTWHDLVRVLPALEGVEPEKSEAVIGSVCHHPNMGRHARGAAHLRVSVSTVVLGTLIVTVVAVGSLWSSHAQPTPIAAQVVDGTAVVVSSLACQNGAGGTQVDVLSPAGRPLGSTVRATLDACGYQEGEQLAVQFPVGDPTQVSLLGGPVDETVTGGRLLPYGLGLAALLALGAAAAVWVDGRRGRRTRASTPLSDNVDPDSFGAGVPDGTMLPLAADSADLVESVPRPVGRHAHPDDLAPAVDREPPADRELSSVDLSFPFTASLADCLHDELFTHRTVWS